MRGVAIMKPGGPEVLEIVERPAPAPGPTEVQIRVAFAGVNRPDIVQRKGSYPPPPGASDLPGLEVSGVVSACGERVSRWHVGDRVCALLPGGGYAELTVADEEHCLPIPEGLSLTDAAALPETLFTVWSNVFARARLAAGETLLVHGGAGGIGTTAIMLGKAIGARVVATAGDDDKVAYCRRVGADDAINYKTERFEEKVRADVILDVVGAPYLGRNLTALNQGGRLTIIGLQGGNLGEIDLRTVLNRHLTITASTLRPRSKEEKARLAREVERHVWPLITSGAFRPHVELVLPLARAGDAHAAMESSTHKGKIVLSMEGAL